MPTLAEDYFSNPTGSLVTVRCRPWRHLGKVVLLGDAAHAVVPFYGQGANAAFEDCTVLAERIEARQGDLDAAFAEYEALRKANTDALADLAVENFVEMRDHTASRLFHLRKQHGEGAAPPPSVVVPSALLDGELLHDPVRRRRAPARGSPGSDRAHRRGCRGDARGRPAVGRDGAMRRCSREEPCRSRT